MPDISALNQFKADMYPCSYKALLVGGNNKKKRKENSTWGGENCH